MRTCQSCGLQNPDDRDFCECGEYLRWDPTGVLAVPTPATTPAATAAAPTTIATTCVAGAAPMTAPATCAAGAGATTAPIMSAAAAGATDASSVPYLGSRRRNCREFL
jgi:hypothetical protein